MAGDSEEGNWIMFTFRVLFLLPFVALTAVAFWAAECRPARPAKPATPATNKRPFIAITVGR